MKELIIEVSAPSQTRSNTKPDRNLKVRTALDRGGPRHWNQEIIAGSDVLVGITDPR